MIAALLTISNAFGASLPVDVEICVQYDVDYNRADDPGGTFNYAAGDYWTDNSVHQPAMHQFIVVEYDLGTQTVQLGANGCAWVTMDSEYYPNIKFDVEVTNQAEVDGVDVELRSVDESISDTWLLDGQALQVDFTGLSKDDGETQTLTFDAIDGWQFMPIATFMLDRQDWRLDEPVSRDCCLEDGTYDLDGTCSGGNPVPYDRSSAPYLESAPLLALAAKTGNSNHCCGSKEFWDSTGPGPASDHKESMLSVGEDVQFRMAISHELGHVFAGIRMGGWERGEYINNAAEDGCDGDGIGTSDRGIISKEYMSSAMREGWAEYVKIWTWNSPTNATPEVVSFNDLDFDLDLDKDNVFSGSHPYDKAFTSGTGMEVDQAVAGDPTASWVLSLDANWLWHAQRFGAGSCVARNDMSCAAAENAAVEKWNRATVYDVADFWWTLDYHEGIAPDRLLDYYINSCPRGWMEADGPSACPALADDWPYKRVLLSLDHFGVQGAIQPTWVDHVVVP